MKYIRDDKSIKLLGKKIKAQRKKVNISQSQLAFETGIPRSQLGRIERGEVNTGVSTIFAIAKALDVHPKELFNF